SVSFSGSAADPTVTIDGSGFGSLPAAGVVSPAGFTGTDYGNSLWIYDSTGVWNAGNSNPQFDYIGLLVSTYTDSEIVYTFGSAYPTYGSLNQGDACTVTVLDATYSCNVNYNATPLPAALPLFATGLG